MVLRERCRPNRRTPGNGKQKDSGTIGISENSRWSCRCWHSAEAPPDLYARMFRMVTTGNPRPYGVPRERRAEIMHSLCNAKIKLMAAAAIAPVQGTDQPSFRWVFYSKFGGKSHANSPVFRRFFNLFSGFRKGAFPGSKWRNIATTCPAYRNYLAPLHFLQGNCPYQEGPCRYFQHFLLLCNKSQKKRRGVWPVFPEKEADLIYFHLNRKDFFAIQGFIIFYLWKVHSKLTFSALFSAWEALFSHLLYRQLI